MFLTTPLCIKRKQITTNFTMERQASCRTLMTGWLLHNAHASQIRIKTGGDQDLSMKNEGVKKYVNLCLSVGIKLSGYLTTFLNEITAH